MTGFNESWWLGLSSLHTIFAREHNLLCDELRAHYRGWSDERVYQTARLIVSALIAKIHTVEWTPAILGTEVIDVGLKSNWNGPPSNDWLTKLGIWLVDSHSAVGIPKTKPDHHAAPYSLTEDFATVYRMHPLLPDDYRFVDHSNGCAARPPRLPRHPGCPGRRGAARVRAGQRAVLLRRGPSRRDHAAQLPAGAAELRARGRGDRPVRGRPGAHPSSRGAALQRLQDRPAPAARAQLERAVRQRGDRTPPARGLSQHRRGRHGRRPVRRDAARRASASPTPRSGSSS